MVRGSDLAEMPVINILVDDRYPNGGKPQSGKKGG